MFRFQDPWILLLILFLPYVVWYSFNYSPGGKIKFSSIINLKNIPISKSVILRKSLIFLRVIGLALIILAMARPQSGRKSEEIATEGVDIVLAIDTSGSMEALDFDTNLNDSQYVTRLDVVKKVVKDFIKARENDRIGMVVFGTEAYTQCPLTLDHGILLSFLEDVEIGMAGDTTAIGSGIGISVNRLKNSPAKSKVIILLTDGRNNTGSLSPIQAAEIAKTFNIKIYTIGAGTFGKAPFLRTGLFGKQYIYDKVDIDEDTLKKIAEMTNGQYFRATDAKSLENIYKKIDELEKTEIKVKEYMEYSELFPMFLIPGMITILVEILLANTRFRKIP